MMKEKRKKILLLGAGFTSGNMGVWALATGAITSAWHAFPDAMVYLLDYNKEPREYTVNNAGGSDVVKLLNIRFSKKIWMPNNIARLIITAILLKLLPFEKIRNKLLSKNQWLRHISEADIVGSIAGGDSFSDIYGSRRFIYIALPQFLVLLMGKNLFLLPQTIGPFRGMLSRVLARYILKGAKKIYSRDYDGLKEVRKLIPECSIKTSFCHDLGFVLEPRINEKRLPVWLKNPDPDIKLVGINVSGLLFIGGYNRKNMFNLKSNYRDTIHTIIKHFILNYKARIVLVPHVLGDAIHGEGDVAACLKVLEETNDEIKNNIKVLEDYYDHHELKAIIGRCDFFMGSRMHACIAALSQAVPAVGLAYSRKFKGLYESVKMDELVVDLRNHEESEIIDFLDRIYHKLSEYRLVLEKEMPVVKKNVFKLFQ